MCTFNQEGWVGLPPGKSANMKTARDLADILLQPLPQGRQVDPGFWRSFCQGSRLLREISATKGHRNGLTLARN